MITIYKNSLNEQLTENQALVSGHYIKEFINDEGIIEISEERFVDGKMDVTRFYSDIDNEAVVLGDIQLDYPDCNYFYLIKREILGAYIKHSKQIIEDNVKTYKSEEIYDFEGRYIAGRSLDIETGLPILGDSLKNFYNQEIYENYCVPNIEIDYPLDPEFKIFSVTYNDDGTIKQIEFNSESTYDKEYFYPNKPAPDDLETCRIKCDLTIEQMNYFLTDDLLPIPDFDA